MSAKPTTPATKIKTTGELREFLATMMVGVKNGHTDPDSARTMVKIAGQINESFYSEIKVAKVQLEMKREAASMGDLPINSTAA